MSLETRVPSLDVRGLRDQKSQLFLLLLLFLPLNNAAAQPPEIRGVALPLYAADPAFDYAPFLDEIAAFGATHVSFIFPLFVRDVISNQIFEKPGRTPPDRVIERTLRQSRERGLDSLLFPIVLLEDDWQGEEWRGSLHPESLDAWFKSYRRQLVRYAKIAEQENARVFSIGSEFASLEKHADQWRQVAKQVRGHYTGQLIYTTNWDTPDRVSWWDAVDFMAVSAYYEIARDGQATTTTMTNEWDAWKDWLLAHRDLYAPEKRIILSEVGYPSRDWGAAYPWDYTMDTPIDLEEQRRGFEAFIRAWDGEEKLAGSFIYSWIDFAPDPKRGYSIRGKPAAELLGAWYGE